MEKENVIDDMVLKDLVEQYQAVQHQLLNVKELQDDLRDRIVEHMDSRGLASAEVGDKKVTVIKSTTIKFDKAILPYLKQNGYGSFIHEAVDEAGLRDSVRKSEIMRAELEKFISETNSARITIK